ncbi:MAG: indole-3-glycerol phosphate synthase TrpC [Cryomorphaceae bacterium]|jgi:indole-3-glycerol phosphate synthase|nr:indole-3-glycerol phosphate synthase TrpC [Cryomorphaceae bacterium]MBT3504121.1 indole-3-glycerol phosphate synthase TrpC [Cryomorphaceae bacterium]MBT3688724.1 indole-3-glycerol phosphate synthase TrpC [Cryomorphaceae bacterium]MBT4221741.1 indole-3-glycerol phosphate synthase TrpC [Cryomorphaceae bacterium]MBT4292939.1 indole-3-glycerol phosphate synthase TrpC [Cryomorphaceae bacterium]|tara:strand:- start:1233 stop:2024 length:792 start_codon:yes stop_codon:yes gene_type:complete
MKILDKIIHDKKIEIKTLSDIVPVSDLEKQKDFTKKCKSLKESIKKSKSGIICEFKRKSPSNGNINYTSNISDVIKGYEKAGAVGVSILTNKKYFDGSISDINDVKTSIEIPILRKEFVISEYQIIEAKSIGSDSILLIASILSKEQIKNYSSLAKSLGLEVLLEIHSIDELNEVSKYDIDIIGVNNRNLDTLEIDIKNSIEIFKKIPGEFIKISESGISKVESIVKLNKVGYDGFLIGENFMKSSKPEESAYNFIKQVENEI